MWLETSSVRSSSSYPFPFIASRLAAVFGIKIMKEVPPETINLLIEIGESPNNDSAIINLLRPIKHQDFINRLHGDKWKKISRDLATTELIALVRGLTLAEKLLRWSGGSVSAIIWTFREVESRDYEAAQKLADWVLRRTNNPYVPFGGQNHGAKSLSDYRLLSTIHRNKISEGIKKQEESEKISEEFKLKRKYQRNKSAKHRNSEIRKDFIKRLLQKDLTEQLKQLANDQKYSVEFYPTRIANQAKLDFLKTLDEKLQNALLEKLKGKHKGPWGKLKRNLLDIYRSEKRLRPTPWDRAPWFY